jgi:hypothetical protein
LAQPIPDLEAEHLAYHHDCIGWRAMALK